MKKLLICLALLCALLTAITTQSLATEENQTPVAEQQNTVIEQQEENTQVLEETPVIENTRIEVLPTMTTESTAGNRIWVGTFQLVWNEIIDNIIKAPVKFVGFDSPMAENLNKKEFTTEDMSELSYYIKSGIVSPHLKKEIEKSIKKKFLEKSDILDQFNWKHDPHKIFVYSMLKKDFKFLRPFEKLVDGPFGTNNTPVKYFGTTEESPVTLTQSIHVLFHNNDNDFAVKLYTRGKDIVLLYRTDDEKNFEEYFKDVNSKAIAYTESRTFNKEDKLRVPEINLYQETSFPELEGHQIMGTDFLIDKTLETVNFKMDNVGVKLKSEAAVMMKTMSLEPETGRYFMFTDKFVLFLIEKNKQTPYYAMRINDIETINKTGK